LTLGKDAEFLRAFDAFREKRNVSNYDIGGSHREVEEMIGIARTLQQNGLTSEVSLLGPTTSTLHLSTRI
jgi:hypothetical protein